MSTLFHIKNMVCDRCKLVVKDAFEKAGAKVQSIELGEVETIDPLSPQQLQTVQQTFSEVGFELLDDKQGRIVEKIKTLLVELIHGEHPYLKSNYSDYLSEKLNRDYSGLSTLFSQHENSTIEQYIIRQKIERVKELLLYDEQSLSQIADSLQYSSVAHLSNQFKKVTGLTPSQYKVASAKDRRSLDKV
ncbi:helix-turn-helix domain-containing protein [Runella sp.]|uniref:helix-turn-helix domain-containing protein n=1 Tax=Runella sp. TaxID=1960881 RepID=UPI003D0B20C1